MIKHLLHILIFVLGLHAQAQYTYFNQIEGEIGDLVSESTTNIEVVDDGYVVWGLGADNGQLFHFVRKYDFSGEVIDDNILVHEGQYVLSGLVNSFKWNPHIERFVFINSTNLDGGTKEGYLIEFDMGLDTTFTRRYDLYPPSTYPFVFEVESDGYTVVGEQGSMANSEGTFIMKLDFDGNVVWNEILQEEVYQNIYRNWSVLPFDSGYMVFWGGLIEDHFGLITLTNPQGETVDEIEVIDEDGVRMGYLAAVQLNNGDYFFVQPIGYEEVEDFGNPNIFWNKTRIGKFDPETDALTILQEYFTEHECFLCGPIDLEATPDGGAIILGNRGGWFYDSYAWMMKVDVDGNQEWFQEYTYESCDDCDNVLYDIELAPDGGYIAAGKFHNSDIDPRDSPWLLKVDACGDVEWEDCPPPTNGLRKEEAKSFSIYPNPSTGRFTVRTDTEKRVVGYELVDRTGRVLDSSRLRSMTIARTPTQQLTTDGLEISIDAPTGLYLLRLQLDDGSAETYRVEIVR